MNFETFAFVPWEQKRNQIAFLTRKNKSDLAQVLNILRLRGCLQGWQLVPIEGLDEEGVAQVLGQRRGPCGLPCSASCSSCQIYP